MNKKLTSVLLALVMIISLLAAAGPVYSKSSEPAITIKVQPDKTEVQPGDTISYQVILGPVNNWADCEFTFVIPEGLTYVSATVSDEVAEHFQGGWTEKTKRFVIYGGRYTSDADTLLLTVTCTVEESAAGNLKIYLYDPFFCDRTGEDYVINGYDEGVSLDFDSGNSVTVKAPHAHVYDQQVATEDYKASGADCTNAATYYFSCKCGEKGSDTFSYGDPLGHNPGGDWQKDDTHHWKTCQNAGCGVVVEETKVAHTPDHEGGATEEYGIYCTVCGYEMEAQLQHSHVFDQEVATEDYKASGADCTNAATYYFSCKCGEKGSDTFSYGDPLGHNPGGDWQKDDTHHWKTCQNAGCGVVVEETKVAHTPDREGGATEEYGIHCSVCGHEMEAQLQHSHVFDQEVATEDYKASGAGCTNAATYYFSCKCGEKGRETFAYGEAPGHNPGGDWQKDDTHHWKTCQNAGCGVVVEETKVAHTPDHEGGATEEYGIHCSVCGYEMEAQLQHRHVFDQEVATEDYKASGADCTNAATYYYSCKCGEKGSDTFSYGDALGHNPGGDWQKDDTHHWKTCQNAGCGVVVEETKVAHTPDHEGGATEEYGIYCTVCGYEMEAQLQHTHVFGNEWMRDEDNHWNECACGEIANTEAHMDADEDGYCDVCNCSMDTNIPETGDYDMMLFVLLLVGSLTAVALLVVKKKTIV